MSNENAAILAYRDRKWAELSSNRSELDALCHSLFGAAMKSTTPPVQLSPAAVMKLSDYLTLMQLDLSLRAAGVLV